MLNVSDYIQIVLDKKGWSRAKLIEEINKIESKIGESRTTKVEVSQYITGDVPFRPKILAKWELALGLKEGTLINMVAPPITKESKEELKRTIEGIRKLRK